MYLIYIDGQCVFDPRSEYLQAIEPTLELEDCSAGSLTFTLPYTNPYWSLPVKMVSSVTVLRTDDNKTVFEGRISTESTDFYKNKELYCEGALAFLNDTIQPQAHYPAGTSVESFLQSLIDNHNAKSDYQFELGEITMDDTVYRYTNYESTLEAINDKLIDRLGGHMRVRFEGGTRYIDYLAEYPGISEQVIRFGQNLLDYSTNFDMSDIATVIIPLGKEQETETEETDDGTENLPNYLTVASVNNGSIYVKNEEAVATYGWICKTVTWSDVTEAKNLLTKAKEYLEDFQYEEMVLEVKAVDLALTSSAYDSIDLLDMVRVVSTPHGLDRYFPVTKRKITLNDLSKEEYTLGSNVMYSLTDATSSLSNEISSVKDDVSISLRTELQAAIDVASALITGNSGGYVVLNDSDGDGYPDEILIMDAADKEDAKSVWRWNKAGLGYSSTGYDGKFGTAITMDGKIVADYITTGTLSASRINGGILKLGGKNNGSGIIQMYDSSGELTGYWNNSGLSAYGNITLGSSEKTRFEMRAYRWIFYYDNEKTREDYITNNSTYVIADEDYRYSWHCGSYYALQYDKQGLCIKPLYDLTTTSSANVNVTSQGFLKRYSSSSKRYKHDIKEIDNYRDVLDIPVVTFKYNEGYIPENDIRYQKDIPGFIAEDVEKAYPIAVDYQDIVDEEGNATGEKQVEDWNPRYIIPPMLALIQEHEERIAKLEEKLSRVEEQLKTAEKEK